MCRMCEFSDGDEGNVCTRKTAAVEMDQKNHVDMVSIAGQLTVQSTFDVGGGWGSLIILRARMCPVGDDTAHGTQDTCSSSG